MTEQQLINMLAKRAKVRNLYVNERHPGPVSEQNRPSVLTEEEDDDLLHNLMATFGGEIHVAKSGKYEGKTQWFVLDEEAKYLMRKMLPQLHGWRAFNAASWLSD